MSVSVQEAQSLSTGSPILGDASFSADSESVFYALYVYSWCYFSHDSQLKLQLQGLLYVFLS